MRNVLYLALTSFLLIGCSSDTSKKEDIEKQKPLIFADALTPDKVKNTETIQKQETEKLPKVVEQPLKTPPAYLLKNKTVQQDEPKPCDTPTTEPCAVEIPTPKETQSTPVVEKKYHSNAANSILFQRLPATFVKTYDLTPPRGSSIGLVQAMLKYPVTGYFSSRFGKAIKQYQAKAKMNPTGKIDLKLWNRLLPKTKSAPDFQTRARELSMTIEPGTYSDCEFHWDKENEKGSKGLIWGVMALGLKDSQIQRVLKLSLHRASDKIKNAAGESGYVFLEGLAKLKPAEGLSYVRSYWRMGNKYRQFVTNCFKAISMLSVVRYEYMQVAIEMYQARMDTLSPFMDSIDNLTEIDWAMLWDFSLHIQDMESALEALLKLPKNPQQSPIKRRESWIKAIGQAIPEEQQKDFYFRASIFTEAKEITNAYGLSDKVLEKH